MVHFTTFGVQSVAQARAPTIHELRRKVLAANPQLRKYMLEAQTAVATPDLPS